MWEPCHCHRPALYRAPVGGNPIWDLCAQPWGSVSSHSDEGSEDSFLVSLLSSCHDLWQALSVLSVVTGNSNLDSLTFVFCVCQMGVLISALEGIMVKLQDLKDCLFSLKLLQKVSYWRRKWHPTLVFLPGKSHGQRSMTGYSPWGRKRVGHDLATKQQQIQTYTIPVLSVHC